MFQSARFDDIDRDPYGGVPLGAEAIVSFLHEPAEIESSRDEDRPATGQVAADPRCADSMLTRNYSRYFLPVALQA